MTELDKFKRRLIRAIARRMIVEKMSEDELWGDLRKETGCDCKLLWNRMRALTIKKFNRLLAADDCKDQIAEVARLTFTDWLLFDLVLVHEKVDLITNPACEGDPAPLLELFSLVQRFQIEGLSGDKLAEAWAAATRHYNNASRQCSPMLLQRRWYQVKEETKDRFYKFWFEFRGNSKYLPKAKEMHQPTPLHIGIVKRYPKIVLDKFPDWEEAIRQRLVILPEEFSSAMRRRDLPKPCDSNDPDLVVVEPNIETIDLDDSNSEKNDAFQENTSDLVNKLLVDIKKEPNECIVDGLSNVQIVEATHIAEAIDVDTVPRSKEYVENLYKSVSMKVEQEESDIEKTEEIETIEDDQEDSHMPKIVNSFGNALIPQVFRDEEDINISEEGTFVDSIVQSTLENSQAFVYPEIKEASTDKIINKTKDQITDSQSSSDDKTIDDLVNDILKQKTDDYVKQILDDRISVEDTKESENPFAILNDSKLIHVDIEFADYGVEFEEDDITIKTEKNDEDVKLEPDEEGEEDAPKFDLKLLMDPVVYTTRLDNMSVFNDTTFEHVNDSERLEKIIEESRPVSKKEVTLTNLENQDDNNLNIPKLTMSSCLLQKPRSRSYNPIQLCKNPDFNTRLKWLTVGFLSSTRNRQLLNSCKPMTIDVDKGFESKLINGTLYLDTNTPIISGETIEIDDENQKTSVLPLVMPAQSLFDSNEANIEEPVAPPQLDKPVHENMIVSKGQVINLNHINVRRINQHILAAEVTPMNFEGTSRQKVDKQKSVLNIDNTKIGKKGKLKYKDVEKKPDALSWGSKYLQNIKIDDCLLTDTALVKMLFALDSNKIEYKVHEKKTKKGAKKIVYLRNDKTNSVEQKIDENTSQKLENKIDGKDLDHDDKTTQKLPHDLSDQHKIKTKSRLKPKPKSRNAPSEFCCWAREKIYKTFANVEPKPKSAISVHKCSFPLCTCCCKLELATFYRIKNKQINNGNSNLPSQTNQLSNLSKQQKGIACTSSIVTGPEELSIMSPVNYTIDISDDDEDINKLNDLTKDNKKISSLPDVNPNSPDISVQTVPENKILNNDNPQLKTISNSVEDHTGNIKPTPIKVHVIQRDAKVKTKMKRSPTSIPPIITTNPNDMRNVTLVSSDDNIISSHSPIEQIGATNDLTSTSVNSLIRPRGKSAAVSVSSTSLSTSHKKSKEAEKRRIVVDGTSPNVRISNDTSLKTSKCTIDSIGKVIFLDSKSISKTPTECPIFLGKNKILLTTVKLPGKGNTGTEMNLNDNNMIKPIESPGLPNGVQLVLLPNGKLSYLIQPNVQLTPEEEAALPAILSVAQQQISSVNIGNPFIPNLNFSQNEEISSEVSRHADDSQNNATVNIRNTNSLIGSHENKSFNGTEKSPIDDSKKAIQNKCDTELPTSVTNSMDTIESSKAPVSTDANELSDKSEQTKQLDSIGSLKKTILSDLMEMVGISTEDTKLTETQETISTVPTPITEDGIKQTFSTLHELSPITSLFELRYACENNGTFFKLDFNTGIIAPINVSIKKTLKPLEQKELFIDLTEDLNDEPTNIVQPQTVKLQTVEPQNVEPRIVEPQNVEPRNVEPQTIEPQTVKLRRLPRILTKSKSERSLLKTGGIKPLKLFRAVHPSILKTPKQKLISLPNNTAQDNNELKVLKPARQFAPHRSKQNINKIEVKIDLVDPEGPFEEEYLVDTSGTEDDNISQHTEERLDYSDSSDDEPLAKKVKRKDAATENRETRLEKESDNWTEDMVTDTQLMEEPQLDVPELMEVPNSLQIDNEHFSDSEATQDVCILGF